PPDEVLAARVRSRMGLVITHPRAIEVVAHGGEVTLHGPILAGEAWALLSAIRRVPGVSRIVDRLDRHDRADVPAVAGGRTRPGATRATLVRLRRNWSPSARLFAGATGTGLPDLWLDEADRSWRRRRRDRCGGGRARDHQQGVRVGGAAQSC